jgi:hypothetical protein
MARREPSGDQEREVMWHSWSKRCWRGGWSEWGFQRERKPLESPEASREPSGDQARAVIEERGWER